jgi:hypothetical protein
MEVGRTDKEDFLKAIRVIGGHYMIPLIDFENGLAN